jgi:hypothetical protein
MRADFELSESMFRDASKVISKYGMEVVGRSASIVLVPDCVAALVG